MRTRAGWSKCCAKEHPPRILGRIAIVVHRKGVAASVYSAVAWHSQALFSSVWTHVQRRASRRDVPSVGHTRKIYRMIWCLAEAIRAELRGKLADAATIALHLDKGLGRLHIRATAADKKLSRVQAVLGCLSMTGGHVQLIETAETIICRFCTPHADRPASCVEASRKKRPKPGKVCKSLLQTFQQQVHLWNADSAGDVQLAGQVARAVFPKLKAVSWDAPHASRRTVSRPWCTDAFLQETLQMFLTSKGSIVRLIQNSQEFKAWYQENVRKMPGRIGLKVSNLSWAKHRYDSLARPLGRAIHNVFAVVQTAVQIWQSRSTHKEGKLAKQFLLRLRTEHIVQLALLADAAHEAMTLTRLTDAEDFSTERLSAEVASFVNRTLRGNRRARIMLGVRGCINT